MPSKQVLAFILGTALIVVGAISLVPAPQKVGISLIIAGLATWIVVFSLARPEDTEGSPKPSIKSGLSFLLRYKSRVFIVAGLFSITLAQWGISGPLVLWILVLIATLVVFVFRLKSNWLFALIICVVSSLMAQGCEEMLDGVGEDNARATVLIEIDKMTGLEYAIDRGLVLAHEGLVPGVLKVKDTEVCAYELVPQGSEPILLCKPMQVWMEDPAAQIIWLAWFYTVALAGLYFGIGLILFRMCRWVVHKTRQLWQVSGPTVSEVNRWVMHGPACESRKAFLRRQLPSVTTWLAYKWFAAVVLFLISVGLTPFVALLISAVFDDVRFSSLLAGYGLYIPGILLVVAVALSGLRCWVYLRTTGTYGWFEQLFKDR